MDTSWFQLLADFAIACLTMTMARTRLRPRVAARTAVVAR